MFQSQPALHNEFVSSSWHKAALWDGAHLPALPQVRASRVRLIKLLLVETETRKKANFRLPGAEQGKCNFSTSGGRQYQARREGPGWAENQPETTRVGVSHVSITPPGWSLEVFSKAMQKPEKRKPKYFHGPNTA